jgi:hypothetical protein
MIPVCSFWRIWLASPTIPPIRIFVSFAAGCVI